MSDSETKLIALGNAIQLNNVKKALIILIESVGISNIGKKQSASPKRNPILIIKFFDNSRTQS